MPRRVYREGFRITTDSRGIRIEALDYHCSPLILDAGELAELGLRLAGPETAPDRRAILPEAEGRPSAPRWPELLEKLRRRRPARRGSGRP